MTKYIFVTGGVVSGLGTGITAASLGRLLKARGLKVAAQKLDPYINVDPGTMNPFQHGEVFVTEDGAEILIHVGLDTVELKGEHFTSHVEAGRKVKKGDLLLTADIEKIKAAGYDTVTPIVICNTDAFKSIEGMTGKEVKVGDDILQLSK